VRATGRTSSPRVSVCIPASRPGQFFLEALDSVLAQDVDDLEIIVSDDSGGELEPLVRSRSDRRIRYVANPQRLGLAGNHCRALDLASAEYVAFIHDDDAWHTGYLSAALAAIQPDEGIGMVLVDMEEIDSRGHHLGLRPSMMSAGLQIDPLASFLRHDFLALVPSASLFRRAALNGNVRPWPDVVAGDLTMYVDCILGGWKVYHLAEPLVRYRVHQGQSSMERLPVNSAVVAVFSAYAFAHPDHERRRVRRVVSALVGRAAAHLRAGDVEEARSDLRDARRLGRGERWFTATVLWLLSWLPTPALVRLDPALRAVRDLVGRLRRH
jgi:glycosyltransferase involved in cell wall biosynthesis